jgi:hypothetical protein
MTTHGCHGVEISRSLAAKPARGVIRNLANATSSSQ